MKNLILALSLVLTAASAFAQNQTVVRWRQLVGVVTAPGIDNPVPGPLDANGNATSAIHSGAGPWTAKDGSARVNLATGEGSFEVEGLVLNGGNASGTPGSITSVIGTFVCNPGKSNQAVVDTPPTALSSQGNAELSFRLSFPTGCTSPLFLIRIPGAGRWIATGVTPATSDSFGY